MSRNHFRLAAALLPGLLAAWSSLEAQAPASPTEADDARRKQAIIRGEGVEVTVGEVEDVLAQQSPLVRARYRDPEELKALVNSLARAELLAAEAARRGYSDNPAVRHTVQESAAQALVRLEIDEAVTPQSIPAEQVRAYYEAHPTEFHRAATRRASILVVDGPEEAQKLLADAQKTDARGFAELVKQHSKDATTKATGGDLGYFALEPTSDGTEAQVPPGVRKATFALKDIGDTSAPIALDKQLVIVRLSGERPERHVPLDDAALSIRAKLWRERRQQALDALVAKLRTRDKPQVFAERIEQISFDDMEKRPSGFAPDPVPRGEASTPAP